MLYDISLDETFLYETIQYETFLYVTIIERGNSNLDKSIINKTNLDKIILERKNDRLEFDDLSICSFPM